MRSNPDASRCPFSDHARPDTRGPRRPEHSYRRRPQSIEWGPRIQYDTGGSNAIAQSVRGDCVEVHVGSGNLYYRVGFPDHVKRTIEWGPSAAYDTGSSNAISMRDSRSPLHDYCVEVHVGDESLYYRVGKVHRRLRTIDWGPSTLYDTGHSNAIALHGDRDQCVEVHVGSGKLYYRVGRVDYEKQSIAWGPAAEYGDGRSNAITLNGDGKYCVEVHVRSGRLYYRVGQVDYERQSIAWGPSTEYGKGDLNSISSSTLDHGRRCVEAHVTSGKLFYRVGVVNTVRKTISWKEPGQEYGTGSSSTIANSTISKAGYCIEVHNNSGNLFYRTGVYRPRPPHDAGVRDTKRVHTNKLYDAPFRLMHGIDPKGNDVGDAARATSRATSPGRKVGSVGSVVSHSAPRREGRVESIAQELRNIGHDGTDVFLGQLALEGVIDLDLAAVPHQDGDIRILGDLIVGGPVGALANGERDVLDAGRRGQLLQIFGGVFAFPGTMTTKLLSSSFSPILRSICLTKLAKGSEVLRAKTQTTGAEPYLQR